MCSEKAGGKRKGLFLPKVPAGVLSITSGEAQWQEREADLSRSISSLEV